LLPGCELPGSGSLGQGKLEPVRVAKAQGVLAEAALRRFGGHAHRCQPVAPEAEAPRGDRKPDLDRQADPLAPVGHLRPGKEGQIGAGVTLGIGVEEVIRVGHVLVDGALDQAKAERPGVEVQVLLGIPADGRDVMDAVDGAHDEVPCLIIPGASAPGYPPALVCTGPFVYDLPAGLKGDPMPSILRRAAVFALLALPALAAFAQPAGSSSPRALPGLDLSALDRSVQPCDDFYQFACGGWMAKNPVPPDRSRWGSFEELAIRNRSVMRDVLEKAAKPEPARDRIDQKIGDYYASCMDEAGIEAKGAAPLEPQLHRIAALQTRDEVAAVLARLHAEGVPALFRFTSQPDFKNAVLNIAVVD